jgi:hypothetical protein
MGAASAVMGMKDTGMLGSWKNPAAGNLYSPGGAESEMLWSPAIKKALAGRGITDSSLLSLLGS